MKDYLIKNKLISYDQFGFLSGRSTELQLIQFYRNIAKSIDYSFKSDIVFIDMAKSFDKVSHPKLLFKLSKYGIKGYVYNWLKSYLSNRSQKVNVNNFYSNIKLAHSVLGPLLFLIFINDLPDTFKQNLYLSLFADDFFMYVIWDYMTIVIYDQRLHILNLQKLSTRRLYADLLMAYKIINNYVDVSTETILSTYKAVGSRDL